MHADETIVRKYARFFRHGTDGYDAYGVTTELLLAKVAGLGKDGNLTLRDVMDAAPALLKSGKQEEAFLLMMLVEKRLKQLAPEHFGEINRWFGLGINNWAQCDNLCLKIIPRFFLKNLVPVTRLSEWQDSPLRFQRRAVPVSIIKLLKSTTDYTLFFELITPLMMDNERVVHQGLGWLLREAWKKQPQQAEDFLLQWKDHSARLIFQYATEKMTREEKERFRKVK